MHKLVKTNKIVNLDSELNSHQIIGLYNKFGDNYPEVYQEKNKFANPDEWRTKNTNDMEITEYHWFCFESDTMSYATQLRFTNQPYWYRAVFSGNKSIHYLMYVPSCNDAETYDKIAKAFSYAIFSDKCCNSTINPHSVTRAPGLINPVTGKEQTLLQLKRHVIEPDYAQVEYYAGLYNKKHHI